MSACPPPEQLIHLLTDPEQFSGEDHRAFEAHTETCPRCREAVEVAVRDAETEAWRKLLASGPPPAAGAVAIVDGKPRLPQDLEPTAIPLTAATLPGYLGRLGPYHIKQELGRGAMGIVLQARDDALDRFVAIKVLKPELAASESWRARFEREGRKAAAVKHDHVVAIYRSETAHQLGLPYLVMEYVDGATLRERLRQGALLQGEAADIAYQVSSALTAAHLMGVVHRDIKPSNILLDQASGRAKVSDFGLARALDGSDQISHSEAVVGTPRYMSPEQVLPGHVIDERSDIFSLGVVLYQMLTGERPFRGTTDTVVMQAIVHEEPSPPRKLNHAVKRDLETICLKCLEKEPSRRYQTASALADDLQRWQKGQPIAARPVGISGKLWRWYRRKPGLAAASGVAALFVAATVAVSVAFAFYQSIAAKRLDREQKKTAETLHSSEMRSATFALDRGLSLCEQGQVAFGMLWLARSLELAPKDAHELRRAIRANLAGWRSRVSPLRNLISQEGQVSKEGALTFMALSHNGRLLLTRSEYGVVRLWDTATGSATVLAHPVPAVAFSPDDATVLMGTQDGAVQVRDSATGRTRCESTLTKTAAISAVAFSPDGKRAAAGATDGSVWLLDVGTSRLRADTIIGHRQMVVGIAFSPDSQTVLTGSWDSTARLWDLAGGRPCTGSPLPHSGRVLAVAFSPNGRTVLTGCDDRYAQLWDAATGERLDPPLEHRHAVKAVAFGPDGRYVITGSQDRTARLWDVGTRRQLGDCLVHPGEVTSVAFSLDGKAVLTTSTDAARIWPVIDGKPWLPVSSLQPSGMILQHSGGIGPAVLSPDARTVFADGGESIILWEPPPLIPANVAMWHPRAVFAVAFSSDGRTGLTASEGTPLLWDAITGKPDPAFWPAGPRLVSDAAVAFNRRGSGFKQSKLLGLLWAAVPSLGEVHTAAIKASAISPDSRTLVTGSEDATVRLWDRSGRSRALYPPHRAAVEAVAVDDRSIVTGSRDWTAHIWDRETRQPRCQPLEHEWDVVAVALSPDGRVVLTGSKDYRARLWDVDTGRLCVPPLDHDGPVYAVAFSPDGRVVLTGSADGTARLWDAATGVLLHKLHHQSGVLAAVFSPDGRTVLTGSHDQTARLWDAATGRQKGPSLAHLLEVRSVAFSPDGRTALTGSADNSARLWDAATGKPIGPRLEHLREVTSVAYSPDGKRVLTGGWDRFARLWTVPADVDDEPERLTLWVQVLTGMELEGEEMRALDASSWQERQKRLNELGGPPSQ